MLIYEINMPVSHQAESESQQTYWSHRTAQTRTSLAPPGGQHQNVLAAP